MSQSRSAADHPLPPASWCTVRLAEAPSYGVPGVLFDKSAKGAQAYNAFAQEMIERVKNH